MGTGKRYPVGLRGLGQVLLLALLLFLLRAERVAAGALERAMLGKSTVVDLTHALTERAVSPDTQERSRNEAAGEAERSTVPSRLSTPSDFGTHLELSAAVAKGRPTVARIPARDLLVHAVLLDIAARVSGTADYRATVEDLQAWERRNGRIPKGSVVLLHTGWARRWNDPVRYLNLDAHGVARVPGFSPDALAFLATQRDVRGIGLDVFSPEAPPAGGGEGMLSLLAGRWQLVNLTNLDRLPAKGAKLVIAPLRLEAGSAPARVIAILP